MKTYVVYRHFTGDVWRYVGVGSHKRAVNFHNRSKLYRDWIKANGRPEWEILHEGLSLVEAYAIEVALIAFHGRSCDGTVTLLNTSLGGPGARGHERTAEHRAALAVAAGRSMTPIKIAKIRAVNLGKPRAPETKAKLREANLGKTYGDETKAKVSEASRKMWSDPVRRAKILAARYHRSIAATIQGNLNNVI